MCFFYKRILFGIASIVIEGFVKAAKNEKELEFGVEMLLMTGGDFLFQPTSGEK